MLKERAASPESRRNVQGATEGRDAPQAMPLRDAESPHHRELRSLLRKPSPVGATEGRDAPQAMPLRNAEAPQGCRSRTGCKRLQHLLQAVWQSPLEHHMVLLVDDGKNAIAGMKINRRVQCHRRLLLLLDMSQ
jgi:hypothetical protein